MLKDSIAILSATEPPPAWKNGFHSVGKAAARIRELESALGLQAGKPIWNIVRANKKVQELEAQLAQKASGASVARMAPAPAALTPAQSAVPPRAQQIAIAKLLGMDIGITSDSISAVALWSNVEKKAFQAHVRIPGMDSDAELAKTFWRPEAGTGTARYLRSRAQEEINKILEGGN